MAFCFADIQSLGGGDEVGIKEQVDGALMLARTGNRHGALALLLLAVGASSRRMFTKAQVPRDGDAFCQFLGGRLQKLLFRGDLGPDFPGNSGISLDLNGSQVDLARVLYKYVRNGMIHEAEVTSDVEFEDTAPVHGRMLSASINIHQVNGKLRFGNGWLEALITVVSRARCNASEFGFTYLDAVLRSGISEQAVRAACASGGLKPGTFELIREQMVFAGPRELTCDEGLRAWFRRIVAERTFNGGAVTGMAFSEPRLGDFNGELTIEGLAVVRRIVDAHEVVRS